ncbi:MAG TPA: topoisomerase DNA-binding C4 zinc finger domain-containing protein, partial [Candidatus Saccharicenans sp.]|nr:topoisomerase DNA-binding C4 zinc finger domain-containing protein [Candidatus Saccharicenans sp.]
ECKYKESLVKKETKTIEAKCPVCGSPLVYRRGRYGTFIACSNYPRCKYIHKENSDTGLPCPLGCGGTIIRRKTKRGKYFYGCSHYPKCRFATWDEIVKETCPQCGSTYLLKKLAKKGKPYLYCQKCDYVRYLNGDEQNQPELEAKESQKQRTGQSEEIIQPTKSSADTDEKRN